MKTSVILLAVCACIGSGSGAHAQIEPLTPPKAAPPPRVDADETQESDLQDKRRERRKREKDLFPPKPSAQEVRDKALTKEALTPRPRQLLIEAALVGGSVSTSGKRSGYSMDPTVHLNVFWRKGGPEQDGKFGPWFGARVAPFSGTGFHGDRPGSYNLTYFGPMVGVGKIDPVAQDHGRIDPTRDAEGGAPVGHGMIASMGIAGVSRIGRTPSEELREDTGSDFNSRGVAFDAPGLWFEARYLTVMFGAIGVDAVLGVQTGAGKQFFYVGIGTGAWY
jgi:hypothetical protein